jgi:hypothetical protein
MARVIRHGCAVTLGKPSLTATKSSEQPSVMHAVPPPSGARLKGSNHPDAIQLQRRVRRNVRLTELLSVTELRSAPANTGTVAILIIESHSLRKAHAGGSGSAHGPRSATIQHHGCVEEDIDPAGYSNVPGFQRTTEYVQRSAREPGHQLVYTPARHLPQIRADPQHSMLAAAVEGQKQCQR